MSVKIKYTSQKSYLPIGRWICYCYLDYMNKNTKCTSMKMDENVSFGVMYKRCIPDIVDKKPETLSYQCFGLFNWLT